MVHIDHVGVLEWDGARTIRARPIKGGLETNPGSNAHGQRDQGRVNHHQTGDKTKVAAF